MARSVLRDIRNGVRPAVATTLAIGTVKSRVSRARVILGDGPLPAPDRTTVAVLSQGLCAMELG